MIYYSCTGSKPTIKELQRELHTKVADQWEDIGIQLGIEDGLLRQVKADNETSGRCLREMLRIWLTRVDPPPSWPAIIDALNVLGEDSLAQHLKETYKV